MNPLETSQRMLTWLSGIPPHESESTRGKIKFIVFTISLISNITAGVMASAIFIYQNISVDLEDTLFTLAYIVAALQILYQSIAIILLGHNLLEIFENLLTIYNESEIEILNFNI